MDAISPPLSLSSSGTAASMLRLRITHLWRNGHLPDLANPQSFNELVQARKLYDRDPRFPALADKIRVKGIVARRLGEERVIPTLWHGTQIPSEPQWHMALLVKS